MIEELSKEYLIDDWVSTIGLTVHSIEEHTYDCDDPIEFYIIIFTNGRFVIQRDQGYYTTITGLVNSIDFDKTKLLIQRSIIEKQGKK